MITLPNNWTDVSLEVYLELKSIEDKDGFDLLVEQLAILAGVPSSDLEDLDSDEVMDLMKGLSWLRREPNTRIIQEYNSLVLKDITKITLGEFIDLESYITRGDSGLQYICAVLFKKSDVNKWNKTIYEPYDYDIENRAVDFLDCPITDIFGILKYYTDFRDTVLDTYVNLFEDPDWDKLPEGELDPEEIREIEAEIESDKKIARWGWFRMAYTLADGKPTEIEYILNQPLVYILNLMSMKKELGI